MTDARDELAALIARWNYDKSYAYNLACDGEAGAGTPWDELDDDYRRDVVIPTGHPLADAILAAGWTSPRDERMEKILDAMGAYDDVDG